MISEHLADELKQYFIGRLCSIITQPIALPMDKKDFHQWFTVKIDDIDAEAIVGTDIQRGTKNVFFFPILGIVEEQIIKPDHPEYTDIRNKVEKDVLKKSPENVENKPITSITQMAAKATEVKNKWKTSDKEKPQ